MSLLERGAYDYQYESSREFFVVAKAHIVEGAEVLLGTSKNARLDLVRSFARQYGYTCRLLRREDIPSKRRKGVVLDVRIYSFKPH